MTKRKKNLIHAGALLCAVAIAYILIAQFLFGTAIVKGRSMLPALQEEDRCLIDKLSYNLRAPRRGEIVCMNIPQTRGVSVKRVVGLPGEEIQIKGGRVWINSQPLSEPYLLPNVKTHPRHLGSFKYEIEANSYFVLGDNRVSSTDSRHFGAISQSRVIGKVMLVLW